jgi:hypothetical protein
MPEDKHFGKSICLDRNYICICHATTIFPIRENEKAYLGHK